MGIQQYGGTAGGQLSSDSLLKIVQKLPVGVLDSASSPHVEAPVERESVESQLESGPDHRNGCQGKLYGSRN